MTTLWRVLPPACLLLCASAASACEDDDEAFKVVVATGAIGDIWADGAIICNETVVTLGPDDFLWVQSRDEAIRLRGPRRVLIAKTEREPAGIVTTLSRLLDPKTWGIGKKKRHGGTRFVDAGPGSLA